MVFIVIDGLLFFVFLWFLISDKFDVIIDCVFIRVVGELVFMGVIFRLYKLLFKFRFDEVLFVFYIINMFCCII